MDDGIKPVTPWRDLIYTSYQAWILYHYKHQKKGISEGTSGSKSKLNRMKSILNIKKQARRQEKSKREIARDSISKSLFNGMNLAK